MKTTSIPLDDSRKIKNLKRLKGITGFRVTRIAIKQADGASTGMFLSELHVDYDESQVSESRIKAMIKPMPTWGFESNRDANTQTQVIDNQA